MVDHQLRQIGQLVDDLLEISRVTSGKVRLQKEPVDVATIVAFAIETSRPAIEAHHHRLSIALPPDSRARRCRLDPDGPGPLQPAEQRRQVHRGRRADPPGCRSRGADVVFRVRDNGVGIPPEMLPRVFDLFAQVDHSLDHSQGGLGLGLTLVRSLVEMHGGSVQARSEGLDQRGSEFLVRLPILTELSGRQGRTLRGRNDRRTPTPIATSEMTVRATPARASPGGRRQCPSAQSLAMILKLEGYDVQVAFDGVSALEAVRELPSRSGPDGHRPAGHRWLRGGPPAPPGPGAGNAGIDLLAAVTGYAEDEARRRSEQAGFDHHLVKPVDPDAVLALVCLAGMGRGGRTPRAFRCTVRPTAVWFRHRPVQIAVSLERRTRPLPSVVVSIVGLDRPASLRWKTGLPLGPQPLQARDDVGMLRRRGSSSPTDRRGG